MLRRQLFVLAVVGAALAAVAGVNAGTAKDSFDLKGEVYGNSMFKIEMTNRAGRALKTVKAGTYRIKIEDKGSIHDFHLTGPGVNKSTSISFVGDRIWTVKLKRGTYRFVCDPHASMMRGSFRVT
jgi:plastocyanin